MASPEAAGGVQRCGCSFWRVRFKQVLLGNESLSRGVWSSALKRLVSVPAVVPATFTSWASVLFSCCCCCWLHYARRILVPGPGIEPMSLLWEHGILTTGPPGKSLGLYSPASSWLILPGSSVHGILQAGILDLGPEGLVLGPSSVFCAWGRLSPNQARVSQGTICSTSSRLQPCLLQSRVCSVLTNRQL